MTYAVSVTTYQPRPADQLAAVTNQLGPKRRSRRSLLRTALALSETARISTQVRYRRMRYRHMAS